MPGLAIVTDSTADFPSGAEIAGGVEVVPLVISWDGATYRDKIDLSTRDFYERLARAKNMPTTGAPSQAAFEAVYRRTLATHDGVVSVHLSSKLSGTYSLAKAAAREVDPDRITLVDSRSVSVGLGWLVCAAAEGAAHGEDPRTVADRLEEMKTRIVIYLTVQTLDFLQRGGRIGRARALAGTLLNVKPILSIRDGEVFPVERVRTLRSALARVGDLTAGAGVPERVAVLHGGAADQAGELALSLEERLGLPVAVGEIGSVLGVHGGPGVLGAAVLVRG